MPTVPTYQRQVQQQNVQGEFQQPDMNFAQPFAQASGQIGKQAFEFGMKQKQQADETRVKEAMNKLDAFERGLYDRDTGAFSKKGADALELQDQVETDFNQLTDEIYQSLGNDTQRRMFEEIKRRRSSQIMESVAKYELREYSRYADQQDQTSLELSMELAADNYENPNRVMEEIEKGALVLMTQNDRVGGSKEDYQLKLAKFQSRVHLNVLNRMAEEAPTAAIAYFEENKDDLFGDDTATAEKIIGTKAKAFEADNIATQIVNSNEQTLSVWRKKAREIEDVDLRNKVLGELESRWADVELVEQEMTEKAWDLVEQGTNPEKLDNWDQLSPEARQSMQTRYRQIRQGIEPVNSDMDWLETQSWTPRQLAEKSKAEIFGYRDKLDDAHWNSLVNQWSAARQAASSPEKRQEIDAIQTDKDRVKSAAVNAGLMKADQTFTDLNENEARRYMQFQSNVERRFEAEQFDKGRKLTPTEKQDILDEMTRQTVFVDPGLFSAESEVPVASLVESDFEDEVYVPAEQIPPSAMANMRRIIESNGWEKGDVEERLQSAYAYLLMDNEQAAYEILKGDN